MFADPVLALCWRSCCLGPCPGNQPKFLPFLLLRAWMLIDLAMLPSCS